MTPGSIVGGRYRLERAIGQGGMGEVFLATRLADGAEVVVKTLLPSWARKPEAKRRFAVEARAAASLRHPGIVRVLEFDDEADAPFLVMERLRGRTLSADIKANPSMPPARACAMMRELLLALAAAHGHGVVHRDLKPANVMLVRGDDGSERVVILDFGLARVFDEERRTRLTQTGQILGTPGFLAPEQATGDAVDVRTDVWAAGVILYVMLTGQLPFGGQSTSDRMIAMLTEAPSKLALHRRDIPSEVQGIIDRALQKEPDERFQTAAEMARALDVALGGRRSQGPAATSVHERSASGDAANGPWPRWLLAVAFGIALTLAAGIAVGAMVFLGRDGSGAGPAVAPLAMAPEPSALEAPMRPATVGIGTETETDLHEKAQESGGAPERSAAARRAAAGATQESGAGSATHANEHRDGYPNSETGSGSDSEPRRRRAAAESPPAPAPPAQPAPEPTPPPADDLARNPIPAPSAPRTRPRRVTRVGGTETSDRAPHTPLGNMMFDSARACFGGTIPSERTYEIALAYPMGGGPASVHLDPALNQYTARCIRAGIARLNGPRGLRIAIRVRWN